MEAILRYFYLRKLLRDPLQYFDDVGSMRHGCRFSTGATLWHTRKDLSSVLSIVSLIWSLVVETSFGAPYNAQWDASFLLDCGIVDSGVLVTPAPLYFRLWSNKSSTCPIYLQREISHITFMRLYIKDVPHSTEECLYWVRDVVYS